MLLLLAYWAQKGMEKIAVAHFTRKGALAFVETGVRIQLMIKPTVLQNFRSIPHAELVHETATGYMNNVPTPLTIAASPKWIIRQSPKQQLKH